MVSARELRAEARAWRRAAVAIDADPFANFRVTTAMRTRNRAHWDVSPARLPFLSWWRGNGRVLACLFLALECEDEAKEATRG